MTNYTKFTNLEATGDLKAATMSGVTSIAATSVTATSVTADTVTTDDLTVGDSISAPGMAVWQELGSITFAQTSGTGLMIGAVPEGYVVTAAMCEVMTPFDAGDSNVLELGIDSDADALMAAADIDESTAGLQQKAAILDARDAAVDIYATYTQSGTSATAGEARFWVLTAQL